MLTEKELKRYYRRQWARGKSRVGQALDTAALLAIALAAVFLLLRGQGFLARPALLLSAIASAMAAILIKLFRLAALKRFIPRETKRLSRELVKSRLLMLEDAAFFRFCQRASGVTAPVALQRVEPLPADTLLKILRVAGGRPVTLCTTAPLSDAAQAFCRKTRRPLSVMGPDALFDAALADPTLRPDAAALHAAIERELKTDAAQKKRPRLHALEGGGKKYLLAAAVLFVFSFLTRYTLYYRMMAGLCVSIAAAQFLLFRGAHAKDAS